MKKFLLFASVLCMAAASFGAALPHGNHEFRVDVSTDFENDDGYDTVPVWGGIGFFFADNLELGLYVNFRKTDWGSYFGSGSAWGYGGFAEYSFPMDSAVRPFLCARIGILDGEQEDDTVTNIGGGAGVRFFLTERVSVSATLELDWVSDDAFDFDRLNEEDGDGGNTDITGRIGVRYFFW